MTSPKTPLTIKEVNELSYEEFIRIFGNVIEHCELFAAAVCQERPYSSFNCIHNAFSKFMDDLPITGKMGVLRLINDLVQRGLSSESIRERSLAGFDKMTGEEREKITTLNTKYTDKFGFPFVICVRLNKMAAILTGLEARLKNSVHEEAITGTNEVKKIACLRLKDIVDENSIA